MNKPSWKTYVFWILLTEAVGVLAGLLTRGATQIYSTTIRQPPLAPPAIVFPIVWTILYALMGVGSARVSLLEPSAERIKCLRIYFAQLFFNFMWSIIFFNFQAFGFAFFWLLILWGLILLMNSCFYNIDKLASWLQLPYLLWVTFAGYLNYAVWQLNK